MTLQGSDNSIFTGANWAIKFICINGSVRFSEGADPIDPWAVDSTCSECQVVGRRAVGAGPSVWGTCSVVPLGVFGESQASVCTVLYGDYL